MRLHKLGVAWRDTGMGNRKTERTEIHGEKKGGEAYHGAGRSAGGRRPSGAIGTLV